MLIYWVAPGFGMFDLTHLHSGSLGKWFLAWEGAQLSQRAFSPEGGVLWTVAGVWNRGWRRTLTRF